MTHLFHVMLPCTKDIVNESLVILRATTSLNLWPAFALYIYFTSQQNPGLLRFQIAFLVLLLCKWQV